MYYHTLTIFTWVPSPDSEGSFQPVTRIADGLVPNLLKQTGASLLKRLMCASRRFVVMHLLHMNIFIYKYALYHTGVFGVLVLQYSVRVVLNLPAS